MNTANALQSQWHMGMCTIFRLWVHIVGVSAGVPEYDAHNAGCMLAERIIKRQKHA